MIPDEAQKQIYAELAEAGFKGGIRFNEPLYTHTTFKLGGPSDIFLLPGSTPDVRSAIRFFKDKVLPWGVIGGGSNVLFPDYGFRGGIMKIGEMMAQFDESDTYLFMSAGMPLNRLMKLALQEGYGGFDFLVGIPGTVGGAMAVNAGTRDEWFHSIVTWAEAVNSEGDPVRFMRPKGGYRTSFFKNKEYVITGVAFEREDVDPNIVREKMRDRMRRKAAAQPYGMRSAGSVFKNPPGMSAWELIDAVGLRGYRHGGAQFSEKHCNFIVCSMGATSDDVVGIINLAVQRVKDDKGIELERELVMLGFDLPQPEPQTEPAEAVEDETEEPDVADSSAGD